MKIRITKGHGWSKNEVGETFVVTGEYAEHNAYLVRTWNDEDNEWEDDMFFVRKEDCEIVEEGEGMTETNAKIHVLADETLGGIKREYVEVDRKAEVGEKIVIVNADVQCEEPYNNGDIFETERLLGYIRGIKTTCHRDIHDFEYRVLEPTDIVHIDGERYVLTDRKAEVGEKVIVTKSEDFPKGFIAEVEIIDDSSEDISFYLTEGIDGNFFLDGTNESYRVLVPVDAAEDEPKPADPIDVIASLAQEVAELKRKVSDLETVVERHERINGRHNCEIDTLHKDNRTLGEELARLKQDGNKQQPTGTSFADFCEGYIAYSKAMKGAQQ
ncbi:hypothetical protein ABE153_11675 [Bacillus velezensis]